MMCRMTQFIALRATRVISESNVCTFIAMREEGQMWHSKMKDLS